MGFVSSDILLHHLRGNMFGITFGDVRGFSDFMFLLPMQTNQNRKVLP